MDDHEHSYRILLADYGGGGEIEIKCSCGSKLTIIEAELVLNKNLGTYREHKGIVYIFPRWIRKYVDDFIKEER